MNLADWRALMLQWILHSMSYRRFLVSVLLGLSVGVLCALRGGPLMGVLMFFLFFVWWIPFLIAVAHDAIWLPFKMVKETEHFHPHPVRITPQGITSEGRDFFTMQQWTRFDYFVELPMGLLLAKGTRPCATIPKRNAGTHYDAIRALFSQHLERRELIDPRDNAKPRKVLPS
jgi:hypothetical protein